jgi:hypothetical protein
VRKAVHITLKAVPATGMGVYALECSACGPLGTFTGTDDELADYACDHLTIHGMDVHAQWTV